MPYGIYPRSQWLVLYKTSESDNSHLKFNGKPKILAQESLLRHLATKKRDPYYKTYKRNAELIILEDVAVIRDTIQGDAIPAYLQYYSAATESSLRALHYQLGNSTTVTDSARCRDSPTA
jgi:hypothetical protein